MEKVNKGILIFSLSFMVIAVVAVISMIYIAIAHGAAMKKIVNDEANKNARSIGMCGNILDDNGVYLAYYNPTFEIEWDTKVANRYVNKKDSILHEAEKAKKPNHELIDTCKYLLKWHSADNLTSYMDANFKNHNGGKSYKSKINTAFRKNSSGNIISKGHSFDDVRLIKTFPFFSLPQFTGGLIVRENLSVEFVNRSVTGRTLGQNAFNDQVLKQGLVYAYNEYLLGDTVKYKIEKRARSFKPSNIGEDFIPADGRDVVSTLNYEISEFAYDALMRQMKKSEAVKGCVIVMDVSTGDVKAMVSLVKNNNEYLHSENVAIKHVYEPGSVFKLATFMVAMNDGLLDWNKKYDLGKSIKKRVGYRDIYDSEVPKNQFETPDKIFSESSNIGTCMIAWDLYQNQQQRYIDGLRKMHIGEMTGIEIIGEGKAFLKDTKTKIKDQEWWPVSLVQISYGYEVLTTPLQMATFYNAVANGGVYVKPRLVTSVKGNKANNEIQFPVTIIDTICTPEVAAKACEILTMAAHEGTGKTSFAKAPYSFAGKTGTAQYNVGKEKNGHNASFAGFFPSENPKYTIYVLISQPKGKYYAASVAAPVAREVADKIAATDRSFFNEITISGSTSNVWSKIENMNNNNE